MPAIATVYALQFAFTWIVATIVAVNWCYIFKLSLPQYSEEIGGWTVYTLLMMLGMPFMRLMLLRMARQSLGMPFTETKAWQVWHVLLLNTTGAAVSTSLSGWVALVFSNFSELQRPGPLGFFLAFVVTAVVVLAQALIERRLHQWPEPETSYSGVFLSMLLTSGWSSLAFFWNAVWNRFLVRVQRHEERHDVGFQGLREHLNGPRHKIKTIQDYINGRPGMSGDSDHPGFEGLVVKAAVTLSLGLVALYCLPEAPQGRDSRFWTRRRVLLIAKMMFILIPAYAVTDVGYYFGTKFVARKTGNSALGLFVSFVYAILLSFCVPLFAKVIGWKPRTVFQDRLLELAFWLASYAWWYPWQEVLYQIQGYGLWTFGMEEWLEDLLKILVSALLTTTSTYLIALVFAFWLLWMRRRQLTISCDGEESRHFCQEAAQDRTLRLLASSMGIPVEDARVEQGRQTALPLDLASEPSGEVGS